MEAPPKPAGGVPSVSVVLVFSVLLLLTLSLVILSFPAGFYSVYVGPLGNRTASSISRPYLWLGPVLLLFPGTLTVGAYFLILSLVYIAFLAYAWTQKEHLLTAISRATREGIESLFSSPLAVVLISIGLLVFGGVVIDSLVSSTGTPIGTIRGDPLGLLLGLTASPLVEGLGFRVVLIGLIALILSMGRPARQALRALWRPSVVYEGMAVGGGTAALIWAATGFSAVTFGACHVLCGTTWNAGKFPEAAFGGLVLGYLYVRYGFHVSVLAHWGVDYLGSVYSFFGQAAYGVPWDSSSEFVGQYIVDLDLLLLFGLASFLLVAYLGLRKFLLRRPQPAPLLGSS